MSPFDKFKTLEKICAQENVHLVVDDTCIGNAIHKCRVTVHYGHVNHSERSTGDESITACSPAVNAMIQWMKRKE